MPNFPRFAAWEMPSFAQLRPRNAIAKIAKKCAATHGFWSGSCSIEREFAVASMRYTKPLSRLPTLQFDGLSRHCQSPRQALLPPKCLQHCAPCRNSGWSPLSSVVRCCSAACGYSCLRCPPLAPAGVCRRRPEKVHPGLLRLRSGFPTRKQQPAAAATLFGLTLDDRIKRVTKGPFCRAVPSSLLTPLDISACSSAGQPLCQVHKMHGLAHARQVKEHIYLELPQSARCHTVIVGVELDGWLRRLLKSPGCSSRPAAGTQCPLTPPPLQSHATSALQGFLLQTFGHARPASSSRFCRQRLQDNAGPQQRLHQGPPCPTARPSTALACANVRSEQQGNVVSMVRLYTCSWQHACLQPLSSPPDDKWASEAATYVCLLACTRAGQSREVERYPGCRRPASPCSIMRHTRLILLDLPPYGEYNGGRPCPARISRRFALVGDVRYNALPGVVSDAEHWDPQRCCRREDRPRQKK